MAREDLHFRLRIPEEIKTKVEAAAAEKHRSMTAEIIARLEASFDESQHVWDTVNDLAETLEKLQKTLERIAPRVDEMWSRYEGGSFGGRD